MAMNTNGMKEAANKVAKVGPSKEEQRARAVKPPSQVVAELLNKYSGMIREALGKAMDPERFTRLLVTVICQDPNLLRAVSECPASLIGAIMTAATLGLEPNTPLGHGYLITYFQKNKVKSSEAGHDVFEMRVSFQLGYQGILLLAYRSGDIAEVDAEVVYERDQFKEQLGTNRFLFHVPCDEEDPGAPIKYYAVIKLKSGGTLFKTWGFNKVMAHAKKFSKSFNEKYGKFFGPWADNFDSMAKKTVLLDCLKLAPKSSSFAAQLAQDNTTKSLPANAEHVNILDQRNEDYQLSGEANQTLAIEDKSEAQPKPERAEKIPVTAPAKRGKTVAEFLEKHPPVIDVPTEGNLNVEDVL